MVKILSLIPFTSPSKGEIFYDHVIKYKPKKCLELGFAHGAATNYTVYFKRVIKAPNKESPNIVRL